MSIFYTDGMDNFSGIVISDLDNRAILKIVTAREYATQMSVIKNLKEKYNISIPQPTFSNKVKRNGLKISELQKICDIYGYDIVLRSKK